MSESLHPNEAERPPDQTAESDHGNQSGSAVNDGRPQRQKMFPTWVYVLGCVVGLTVIVGLLLPAVEQIRVPAARMTSSNNLHQMGMAMRDYEETYGTLPPAAITDKQGKPLLSWRVAILPFMEEQKLYGQFKLDEPWDSPNNIKLLSEMPRTYAHPMADDVTRKEFKTYYRVFTGKGTAAGMKLLDITDGTSNTIMIVEASEAVPWTKPDELEYSPTAPLPQLGGMWPKTFLACMADASVKPIPKNFPERDLRAAIGADDGVIFIWP